MWFQVFLLAAIFSHVAFARFDWYRDTERHGKTYLLGSSFGISHQNATFDYVIVGGGTAGLTVAYQLASHPNVTVAVVEAGNFYEVVHGNTSQVPGYGSVYLAANDLEPNSQGIDWGFFTAPQEGLSGRRIHYNAARALGGSSAINGLVFHRSTKGSFDWWANVTGDDDYKYCNFVKYLERSVSFTPPNRRKIPENISIPYDCKAFVPAGSPLQVSYPNYRSPFNPYMERAFKKSGLKSIPGFNSGDLNGYGTVTLTLDPAAEVRSSSSEGFLQEALTTLQSLTVYTNTMARKVLFRNKVAIGVEVETNGGVYTLTARKEVIVSAGALQSPKVLMLSGIGPREQLEAHGIPVISDLHGVGNNLIDQVFIFPNYKLNMTTNSGVLTNPALIATSVDQYLNHQDGPLTGTGGEIYAFEKIPNRTAITPEALAQLDNLPSDWPEAEYFAASHGANPANDTLSNNYLVFGSAVFAPFSRGYVNLTSANFTDPPIVNPNSFSSDTEAQLGVQAMRRLRQFAAAAGVSIVETNPGPSVQTDAEILQWLRDNVQPGYHASSTCRMGKAEDPDSVVDSKARVYGVKGLRVVDASAFAILPPGHPMSTIYALSYKIANDILSELRSIDKRSVDGVGVEACDSGFLRARI